MLQDRSRILSHEFGEWSNEAIISIVESCFIIQNMIIHVERNGIPNGEQDKSRKVQTSNEFVEEFIEDIA